MPDARPSPAVDLVHAVALRASELGAVYTKRWAVDLVLDLAGYTSDADLSAGRIVEPSCGDGAFLVAIVERLAKSCANHGKSLDQAATAIRAWDLDPQSVQLARQAVRETLRRFGVSTDRASRLARTWVQEGDFLLADAGRCDWVVGNPPYVRIEDVPTRRSSAYRERWDAMRGRADVYVGFIQAGLRALRPGGVLSFICADRWMRNQYGKHLRKMVENDFSVETLVTLHDSDAFENRVTAYPSIFTLRASVQGPALIVDGDRDFAERAAQEVVAIRRSGPPATTAALRGQGYSAMWTASWFAGAISWPTGTPERIAAVSRLEHAHPTLHDQRPHTRIGIGLASGADAVYLTDSPDEVDPGRALPMVMASDLSSGAVEWSGTHLVNPWTAEGSLVHLDDYPRLRSFLEEHRARLLNRHVAKRRPQHWFRTIDRPVPGLAERPKLLLPDLRQRVTPVLEPGGLYPHHNLFWITSDRWDLRVLGGLLLSDYGTLFVETYSPRMAGGALRITGQYLRRIRVPRPEDIPRETASRLAEAFDNRDVGGATEAAKTIYTVNP